MFDFHPWTEGGGWLSMIAAAPRPTMRNVLRGGHLAVTVTIVIFLFQQYEATNSARSDMRKDIAVNVERINAVSAACLERDQEMSHRVDLHRVDIDRIQQQLIDHVMQDSRRTDRRN